MRKLCIVLAATVLSMLSCAEVDSNRYQKTLDPVYGQSHGLYYDSDTGGMVHATNGVITNRWDSSGNPSSIVASEAAGDLLIHDGTTWVRLGVGAAGAVPIVNAGATAPEWLAVGTANQVFATNAGATAPEWVTTSGDLTNVAGVFTVTDVTVGSDATADILYKSSATALARLGIGTAGQYLATNTGATAPEWASHVESWAWQAGGALGEDTDAAGTNGGGMVGQGIVDVTTYDYNSAGGTATDVHCKVYDAGDAAWDELATASSLTGWTANYQLLPDAASEATGDAFAVGFANQFVEIVFNDLATNNGALATWSGDGGKYQYSTGAGTWSDLTVFDNTDTTASDGLRSLVRTGAITFATPADWVVATYDSQEAFWVQYVLTGTALTQTPVIDDTNFDEPIVGVPDASTFIAPHNGSITAIRVTNTLATVHDQAILFSLGSFAPAVNAAGFSHSAQQTWTASQATMRFDLSARPVEVLANDRIGIMVQNDTASTNNPQWAVDMTVTVQ